MTELTWLMASYHMASAYSIKVPMMNPDSGKALPTPGPATVQLAMIRTAIELFGVDAVRSDLFRHIVAHCPRIKPPDRVAVCDQVTRAFKAEDRGTYVQGMAMQEVCHAVGPIKIYIPVPGHMVDVFENVLFGIGYWGQSNGFACCVSVEKSVPSTGEFTMPLEHVPKHVRLQRYFTEYVTEIASPNVDWQEVVLGVDRGGKNFQRCRHYVWPLMMCEHHSEGRTWKFCSLL